MTVKELKEKLENVRDDAKVMLIDHVIYCDQWKERKTMKFLIITSHGVHEIEAEDFAAAADQAYDDHTGYKDVYAIVKVD